MKPLIFCLFFVNSSFSQVDSSFRYKKEIFCGVNYDVRFDTTSFGPIIGYTSHINKTKKMYFRLDMQYSNRFYNSTHANEGKDAFWYEDLSLKSVIINTMFSYRFYQKRHDHFYFELGAYLGINLWQEKNGKSFTGFYQTVPQNFKKTYIFLPDNTGIHLGFGIRVHRHILLKPELRLGVWSFDKLFEGSGVLNEMILNTRLQANFNVAYLF